MEIVEFKALLSRFNLSYQEGASIVGVTPAAFKMGVSRGSRLADWGNRILLSQGEAVDLGVADVTEDVTKGAKSGNKGGNVTKKGNKPADVTGGHVTGPAHNENGIRVALLPGLSVVRKSAEPGHPEWDIMSDGFARGYRFDFQGVPTDDDVQMRSRYRTPAAIRRMVEALNPSADAEAVTEACKDAIVHWEKTGEFPAGLKHLEVGK